MESTDNKPTQTHRDIVRAFKEEKHQEWLLDHPQPTAQERALEMWTKILDPDDSCYEFYATVPEWRVSIERLIDGLKSGELNASEKICIYLGRAVEKDYDSRGHVPYLLIHNPDPIQLYAKEILDSY